MDIPALTSKPQGLSVIVPAHNEADVLPLALDGLVDQCFDGELDIVVIANGCRDRTAQIARSYIPKVDAAGFRLRVCELETPSKTAALNEGDALKAYGSTMYLDADVVLSNNAAQLVYTALQERDGVALASPRLLLAPSKSLISRAYGRVWSRLPYMQRRVAGVGCYAVSEEGRKRWRRFPDLLADDRFARLHFGAHEQHVADDATYVWPLPEGLLELLTVRARWLYGNVELRQRRPDLDRLDDKRYQGLIRYVVEDPRSWGDIVIFVFVYGVAWLVMGWKRSRDDRRWSRATRARALRQTTQSATSATMQRPVIRRARHSRPAGDTRWRGRA